MLKKIHDEFYIYRKYDMHFHFAKGPIGVYARGECWRLDLIAQGVTTTIACFVTEDDGHKCFEKWSHNHMLWSTANAINKANEMITNIITAT